MGKAEGFLKASQNGIRTMAVFVSLAILEYFREFSVGSLGAVSTNACSVTRVIGGFKPHCIQDCIFWSLNKG